MTLKLDDKKAIVESVNSVASEALSALVADYQGLTVEQLTVLRKEARESGVTVQVVRNTLAKRAVQGTDYACLEDVLVGPTVLAFSHEDPGAAARLFKKYSKEYKALEVKALALGGNLLGTDQLEAVASLPTYEEALAKLMATMKAPANKLVQTINAVPTKLVRTLVALKDQKEAA
ncbi:MAG: 50S ribosomal protein L10 [Pseudomonadota bacterium]|nr:50S ribosomal protein L10 [Pseudomonadota bacterium]